MSLIENVACSRVLRAQLGPWGRDRRPQNPAIISSRCLVRLLLRDCDCAIEIGQIIEGRAAERASGSGAGIIGAGDFTRTTKRKGA